MDDASDRTLEEIGKELSVTRERVRQIEKDAMAKMRLHISNEHDKDLLF